MATKTTLVSTIKYVATVLTTDWSFQSIVHSVTLDGCLKNNILLSIKTFADFTNRRMMSVCIDICLKTYFVTAFTKDVLIARSTGGITVCASIKFFRINRIPKRNFITDAPHFD